MSFKIFAVGNLSDQPELGRKGECRFSLISNDYAGPDKPKTVTQVWFVAFAAVAAALAAHCRKGDQLIVEGRMVANNFEEDGKTVYRYSHVVESFEFGAPGKIKRDARAATG